MELPALSLEDGCAECPLFNGSMCVSLRREPAELPLEDEKEGGSHGE